MKRNILATAIAGMTTLSGSWAATAAEVEFHGDMDNRFQAYTNQRDWFAGGNSGGGTLKDDEPTESFGEVKYRFWAKATSDDKKVTGVFATEIGGIRYGEGSGGDYSGDGVNIETRWAYVDFLVPNTLARISHSAPTTFADQAW